MRLQAQQVETAANFFGQMTLLHVQVLLLASWRPLAYVHYTQTLSFRTDDELFGRRGQRALTWEQVLLARCLFEAGACDARMDDRARNSATRSHIIAARLSLWWEPYMTRRPCQFPLLLHWLASVLDQKLLRVFH